MRVLSEKVTFAGQDGQQLAARLDRPEGSEPQAVAIFAHCFTCTKDILAAKSTFSASIFRVGN